MGKKKNKNKPTIDVEVETSGGPPADPDVPDLPTPKVNVHVSATNTNQNANANANVNGNANGKNPSVHLHHDHAHNHHHSHYARSVDRDSAGNEQVTERKETADTGGGGGGGTTVVETKTVSQPAAASVKVPTLKALSAAGSAPVPGSPAGSVKSLKSRPPPEVIVNITLPQPAAPAPVPPVVAPPPPPPLPQPTIAPTAIPLPPSIPPSPVPSIRSLKPPKSMKGAPSVVRVKAVPIPEDPAGEEVEETTVVTTTKTVRKAGTTPPKAPSPPLAAPAPLPVSYPRPGTPLVVNDPTFLPLPDSRPPPASINSRTATASAEAHGPDMMERTVTETVTYPVKEKGSFLDKFKLPKFIKPTDTGPGGSPPRKMTPPGDGHITVHVHGGKGGGVDVDVDTAATTIGGPTTKGITGARTAALGSIRSFEPGGTKAGLKPIPISASHCVALCCLSPGGRQGRC